MAEPDDVADQREVRQLDPARLIRVRLRVRVSLPNPNPNPTPNPNPKLDPARLLPLPLHQVVQQRRDVPGSTMGVLWEY